jgi:hypothetical protein
MEKYDGQGQGDKQMKVIYEDPIKKDMADQLADFISRETAKGRKIDTILLNDVEWSKLYDAMPDATKSGKFMSVKVQQENPVEILPGGISAPPLRAG